MILELKILSSNPSMSFPLFLLLLLFIFLLLKIIQITDILLQWSLNYCVLILLCGRASISAANELLEDHNLFLRCLTIPWAVLDNFFQVCTYESFAFGCISKCGAV